MIDEYRFNCDNYPSLYGNYRNRKFSDIYPTATAFVDNYLLAIPTEFQSSGSGQSYDPGYTVDADTAKFIYYLLYARYGNSTIAASDENRFKFQVSSIIFQYGPLWRKELDIQKALRNLSDAEIKQGSFMIANHALNPSSAPSTASLTELTKIDAQNTNRWVKSPLEGYANLLTLLNKDATEEFLNRFRKLFIKVVEPEIPLWYITEEVEQ